MKMGTTTAVLVKIFIVQLYLIFVSCQYENSNYGYYGSYPGYYDYSQVYQYLQSASSASYAYPRYDNYQYTSTSNEAPQQTQSIVIITNDSKDEDCCYNHHRDPILVPYPIPMPCETKCDCGCSECHVNDYDRKYYDSEFDCKYERRFMHHDSPCDRCYSYFDDEDCYGPFGNQDYEFEYSSCPCSKTNDFDSGCHRQRKHRSRSNRKHKSSERYRKEKSCKCCDHSERWRYRD